MVHADRVPIWFAGSNALDLNRVVPTPGLTDSPSRLIVLAIVKCLCAFEQSTVMRSKLTAPTVDPVGPQEPPATPCSTSNKVAHFYSGQRRAFTPALTKRHAQTLVQASISYFQGVPTSRFGSSTPWSSFSPFQRALVSSFICKSPVAVHL